MKNLHLEFEDFGTKVLNSNLPVLVLFLPEISEAYSRSQERASSIEGKLVTTCRVFIVDLRDDRFCQMLSTNGYPPYVARFVLFYKNKIISDWVTTSPYRGEILIERFSLDPNYLDEVNGMCFICLRDEDGTLLSPESDSILPNGGTPRRELWRPFVYNDITPYHFPTYGSENHLVLDMTEIGSDRT